MEKEGRGIEEREVMAKVREGRNERGLTEYRENNKE